MKNYNLFTINENLGHNKNKAHCLCCGDVVLSGEGYRVFIPSKGNRVVCRLHYGNNNLVSYHNNASAQREIIGTEKITPLAKTKLGVEIETYGNTTEINSVRAYFENIFIVSAESDCTVSAEFPTSIMEGLNRISKVLQSLEYHNALSILNNSHVGAHIHVECNDIPYIRRYYHSIFIPLFDYINEKSYECRVNFFGRDFGEWCSKININTTPTTHSNFINTQHNNTLELRLPRVTSYKQYMQVLKFWRECGYTINNFDFCKNSNDNIIRKQKARECGLLLVTIAKKYF